MNMKKRLICILLSISLFLTGCSKIIIPTNANAAFENFTYSLFQQEVTSNTINLHYSLQDPNKYGITETPITLGSFTIDKASALASIENLEAALRKFSYQSLSEENQLTYDILTDYLNNKKISIDYQLYDEPLSPITGIHAQLPVLLAEYQFQNQEDVDTYLALLKTLPDYFSSLARFEEHKSEAGLFMCDSLAEEVIAQCNAFVSMGNDNYLLSTFEERLQNIPNLSEKQRTNYLQENTDVLASSILPAYESLSLSIASLKGTGKNQNGLCALPKGEAYYEHLVKTETGSRRTMAEIKTLIYNQISTDLLQYQQILRNNPAILEETDSIKEMPETILNNLKHKISDSFPDTVSVNVEVKYVPSALEEYLSPAFYLIPAIDNFKENTIYINQAHSFSNVDLFTTLAHEGYPGHLYQTIFYANTDPDPLRTILNYTGYVEGWATYAEMCSYYISPLSKPNATFLQKNNSLILGLYAAADLGIHYENWSLDDTISFFQSYGINSEETIQEIYKYIAGDPANYITYYLGYLEILELQKDILKKEGSNFNQKAFHQRLLELGPAPFDIIQKHY
mgnify:CR=1 FL=1